MCDYLEGNSCVGAVGSKYSLSIQTGVCKIAGGVSAEPKDSAPSMGKEGTGRVMVPFPRSPGGREPGEIHWTSQLLIPQGDRKPRWDVGAWLLSPFLLKTQFPPFVYELRGGVCQSWKMPQRGSDQRQTLKCVLRWISLPNTLMWLKPKFHRQLFSICLAIIMAMPCALNGGLLVERSTKWI